jgi:hypothetical protein
MNSMLESVRAGIPLLCFPCSATRNTTPQLLNTGDWDESDTWAVDESLQQQKAVFVVDLLKNFF